MRYLGKEVIGPSLEKQTGALCSLWLLMEPVKTLIAANKGFKT